MLKLIELPLVTKFTSNNTVIEIIKLEFEFYDSKLSQHELKERNILNYENNK